MAAVKNRNPLPGMLRPRANRGKSLVVPVDQVGGERRDADRDVFRAVLFGT
jgi:hypothetical protein